MIITVNHLKGGLCRTTMTIMLAKAFQRLGYNVAVVDATSLGDCTDWLIVSNSSIAPRLEVHPIPVNDEENMPSVGTFTKQVEAIHSDLGDNGVVLIDTSSHSERVLTMTRDVATHILIPADDAPASLEHTIDTIKAAQRPFFVVPINDTTQLPNLVSQTVDSYGGSVTKTHIPFFWDLHDDTEIKLPDYLELAKEIAAA